MIATLGAFRLHILFAVLVASLLVGRSAPAHAADPPRPMRRIAVVVGANEPAPGRQALRYAHADAKLIADVLERVGRFAKSDIHVLLEPRPGDVLAALERAANDIRSAGTDTLLLFYYSGHSDGQQVFPHGEPLALSDLRDRVARASARVRVAIVDTCRGGSWTRAKGLTVGPALDASDLMNIGTEGTALLSSSSGVENAHEAAAVRGSFFTHHVAAGLLGAADKSGDGNVTLQEVFDYAKERTVRDSARMAVTTQHPSFDLQLRGRQDIVLAQIAASSSALEVAQANALEIIHLESGVTVAETPPGRQRLRLALVPGRYLVRRVADGRVYSKEIDVRAGATVTVDEAQLVVTGTEKLAMKSSDAIEVPRSAHSTTPKGHSEIRFGIGVSTGNRSFGTGLYTPPGEDSLERSLAGVLALTHGITNRLSWAVPVPAFAYRLGTDGSFEVIPRGGVTTIGYSSPEGIIGTVDAGLATRTWLAPNVSIISNASADWQWLIKTQDGPPMSRRSDVLSLRASAGISWNIGDRVTLAMGLGINGPAIVQRTPRTPAEIAVGFTPTYPSATALVGAIQTLGYRPLPLLQVHLTRSFSLDAHASFGIDLRNGTFRDRYLAGFTWVL